MHRALYPLEISSWIQVQENEHLKPLLYRTSEVLEDLQNVEDSDYRKPVMSPIEIHQHTRSASVNNT